MAARKLRITFNDGKTADVQPTLEDRLKFETTLKRNRGWGDLKDNSLKLEPFLAWSAARRENVTALSWEEFTTGSTAALDVEAVKDEEPTPADAELEVDGLGKGTKKDRSTTSR